VNRKNPGIAAGVDQAICIKNLIAALIALLATPAPSW
jgi:hypothetical protein